MNLTKISLHNFRNFVKVDEIVLPKDSLLVAAAPNATGKTNFFEGIVMLLRGKSFRASSSECVSWGENGFSVSGEVELTEGVSNIDVKYDLTSRKIRIEENGQLASLITFYSRYPMVTFLPDDTSIFSRGPAQRRNFLNHILVSSPSYVSSLVQYQRSLKQRNLALKQASEFGDVLAWTDVLIEHATSLWQQRQSMTRFINTHINDIYESIFKENGVFDISLDIGIDDVGELKKTLKSNFIYEQRYGYTLFGPHRDDFVVTTNKKNVSASLSQGQTRGLVIALKIAALRYIENITNEKPILLLDEMLSELDETKQETLLKNLPNVQTLLICTEVPKIVRKRGDAYLLDIGSIVSTKAKKEEKSVKEKEVANIT